MRKFLHLLALTSAGLLVYSIAGLFWQAAIPYIKDNKDYEDINEGVEYKPLLDKFGQRIISTS